MTSFVTAPVTTITDELKAHGASIGVDVEKIRNKYLQQKLTDHLVNGGEEEQLKQKTKMEDAKRMRELDALGEKMYGKGNQGISEEQGQEQHKVKENFTVKDANDRLDRLKICPRCAGQGVHKEHYNYQVKDVNCETCEGEGLLYRTDEGKMVKKSQAPKVEAKANNVEGLEEKARMLAESCGVRPMKEDEAGDLERQFVADNFDAPPMPM